MHRLVGLALLALVASSGCSKAAIVHMTDGSAHQAVIKDADANSVVIEGSYRDKELPRAQIADIDHPGDAAMFTGAGITLAGGAVFIPGVLAIGNDTSARADCPSGGCDSSGDNRPPEAAAIPLMIAGGGLIAGGIALGIWGAHVKQDSMDTANRGVVEEIALVPVPTSDGRGGLLGVVGRW